VGSTGLLGVYGPGTLIDASQHSNAVNIEIEVTYQDAGLWLRIRDDGEV
jgi:nitrate/nitrite-specific signal transduction histidine kinase